MDFNSNSVSANSSMNSLIPSYSTPQYHEEDNEFNIPLDFNDSLLSSIFSPNSMSQPSNPMPPFYQQEKQESNVNLAMDFNNNSVPPNLLLNPISVPSYPMPQYHEASNFNSNSISPNLLTNSMLVPSNPMPQNLLTDSMLMPQNHQQDREEERLRLFWEKQLLNIQMAEAFKSHQKLPLARIRRLMKSQPDVQMVSSESPMLMSKACEIFIQELTLRAWMNTEKSNNYILQPCDVAKAIMQTDTMNFLTEIIPNNLLNLPPSAFYAMEENAGNVAGGSQTALPYTTGFVGNSMMNMDTEPFTAGFMGNPMMNMGSEDNLGNIANESQVTLPYIPGFMGNPMMNVGNEYNAGNIANENQATMPYTAGFMGNSMMNIGNEDNAGNIIAEGSQSALSYTSDFMGNPMNMMNMSGDLEAGNQLIPEPNMMQPPFMPYNFQPN